MGQDRKACTRVPSPQVLKPVSVVHTHEMGIVPNSQRDCMRCVLCAVLRTLLSSSPHLDFISYLLPVSSHRLDPTRPNSTPKSQTSNRQLHYTATNPTIPGLRTRKYKCRILQTELIESTRLNSARLSSRHYSNPSHPNPSHP